MPRKVRSWVGSSLSITLFDDALYRGVLEIVGTKRARLAELDTSSFLIDFPDQLGAVDFLVRPLETGIVVFSKLEVTISLSFANAFSGDFFIRIFQSHGVEGLGIS